MVVEQSARRRSLLSTSLPSAQRVAIVFIVTRGRGTISCRISSFAQLLQRSIARTTEKDVSRNITPPWWVYAVSLSTTYQFITPDVARHLLRRRESWARCLLCGWHCRPAPSALSQQPESSSPSLGLLSRARRCRHRDPRARETLALSRQIDDIYPPAHSRAAVDPYPRRHGSRSLPFHRRAAASYGRSNRLSPSH